MKRKFEFEFEDQSPSTISFEYDVSAEEKISVLIEDGIPVLYVNRQALLFLVKTFAKMALCDYPDGFHVHLTKDFDADEAEALRVILNGE